MINKYKDYLIKVYEKIKSSIVNKENVKIEKFSIVEDIISFISNYNNKYKEKLDFKLILQSDSENLETINKISGLLLILYFEITLQGEESDLNLYNDLLSDINYDENSSSKKNEKENSIDEDDELSFNEFFPFKRNIEKRKRKYNEVTGENELKKFLDSLPISIKHLKTD